MRGLRAALDGIGSGTHGDTDLLYRVAWQPKPRPLEIVPLSGTAAAGEPPAVRAARHSRNVLVGNQVAEEFAILRVPDFDPGAFVDSRGDPLAVRTGGNGHRVRVTQ